MGLIGGLFKLAILPLLIIFMILGVIARGLMFIGHMLWMLVMIVIIAKIWKRA